MVRSLFSGNIGDKMAPKRRAELKQRGKAASDSNSRIGQCVHAFVWGSVTQRNQPECISNSVMKIDEIFLVNH